MNGGSWGSVGTAYTNQMTFKYGTPYTILVHCLYQYPVNLAIQVLVRANIHHAA